MMPLVIRDNMRLPTIVLVVLCSGCASNGLPRANQWIPGKEITLVYEEPTRLVLDRIGSDDTTVVATKLVGRVTKRPWPDSPARVRVEQVTTPEGDWRPSEETILVIPVQEAAAPLGGMATEVAVMVGLVALAFYLFTYGYSLPYF